MLRTRFIACFTLCACSATPAPVVPRYPARPPATTQAKVSPAAPARDEVSARIQREAMASSTAYALLTELTDDIGARPAGSEALNQAIRWSEGHLRQAGHDTRVEPVMVSTWQRGEASLRMLTPRAHTLDVLAIGHSVGTPKSGIEADVVVVHSREELEALGEGARDKIVLFDVPMPPFDAEHNDPGYGKVYWARVHGASLAAKWGARAVLVRSLSAHSRAGVHTGTLAYAADQPGIAAASISTEDAGWITRLIARGKQVRVNLTLSCAEGPMASSGNVIAELRGSDLPNEVVLMGGHLDSWDVGQGAEDDGAGVVISMEALSLLRRLGLTPRRTIRVVLFTNEEAGGEGADAYDAAHGGESHFAAIETDTGGAPVVGLGVDLHDDAREPVWIEAFAPVMAQLAPLGVQRILAGHAGADVAPLIQRGVTGVGLIHDVSHYFDVHHTKADTLDKVDPTSLQQGVAAMATLAYSLANLQPVKP